MNAVMCAYLEAADRLDKNDCTYDVRVVLKSGHRYRGGPMSWKEGEALRLTVTDFDDAPAESPWEHTAIDPAEIAAISILPT